MDLFTYIHTTPFRCRTCTYRSKRKLCNRWWF